MNKELNYTGSYFHERKPVFLHLKIHHFLHNFLRQRHQFVVVAFNHNLKFHKDFGEKLKQLLKQVGGSTIISTERLDIQDKSGFLL